MEPLSHLTTATTLYTRGIWALPQDPSDESFGSTRMHAPLDRATIVQLFALRPHKDHAPQPRAKQCGQNTGASDPRAVSLGSFSLETEVSASPSDARDPMHDHKTTAGPAEGGIPLAQR
jgi:hypothetical protein